MTAKAAFDIAPGNGPDELYASADLGHAFYFDHPLTHLPGLLLLDVGLAAVERAAAAEAAAPLRITRMEAAFRSISALQRPLHARVTTDRPGRYHGTLTQDGKVRAEVSADLAGYDGAGIGNDGANADRNGEREPFDALQRATVRKARSENVFLGNPRNGDRLTIRPSAALDCALRAGSGGFYHPVFLTECFLQLCRTERSAPSAPGVGIPASREILVLVGGRFVRPIRENEILEIAFRPDVHENHLASHPQAKRRTAQIFRNEEIVCHFFCDAVEI